MVNVRANPTLGEHTRVEFRCRADRHWDTAEAHTCGHRPSISDEMMSGGRSRATSCRLPRLRTPSSWLAWAATQARACLRGGARIRPRR
jgi:hypothetical protein